MPKHPMVAAMMAKKKKMADGGMVEDKSSKVWGGRDPFKEIPKGETKPWGGEAPRKESMNSIVHGIMAKKYSQGGMVDHDDDVAMSAEPEFYDENFLSDDEQDHDINLTYPDPDGTEDTEGMGEAPDKKVILRRVMSRVRSK